MSYRLGIDLGGTKIEAVIIDEQFQVVKRERVPTNREDGYEAIIERIIIKEIIKPKLTKIKHNPINSKVRFFKKFVKLFKKFVFISNRFTYFLPFL